MGSTAIKQTEQPRVATDQTASQYLTFTIAGETYAITVLKVREIMRYEEDLITRVPSAAAVVSGVINLRGSVVSVVDLGVKFGLGGTDVTKWTCIVIVEALLAGEITVIGIIVETIRQVISLPVEEIEPPPPFGTRVDADYILGMGRHGKKFLIVLDIDKILTMNMLVGSRPAAGTDDPDEPVHEPAHEPAEEPTQDSDFPEPADSMDEPEPTARVDGVSGPAPEAAARESVVDDDAAEAVDDDAAEAVDDGAVGERQATGPADAADEDSTAAAGAGGATPKESRGARTSPSRKKAAGPKPKDPGDDRAGNK